MRVRACMCPVSMPKQPGERASFSPVCTLALKFPSRSPPSLPLASSRGKYARMVVKMGGGGGERGDGDRGSCDGSNGQRVRGCSR